MLTLSIRYVINPNLPTNEALGLVDFNSLAKHERYRSVLADDGAH